MSTKTRIKSDESASTAAVCADEVLWLNRHDWLSGVDLDGELLQAEQEGRDLSSVRTRIRALHKVPRPPEDAPNQLNAGRDDAWLTRYRRLSERIQTLPLRANYGYEEPSDWDGIQGARVPAQALVPVWRGSAVRLRRGIHGGLLGRICGCLLGKPVAGWYRTSIEVTAKATGNWPLASYLRVPTKRMAERIDSLRPVQKFGGDRKAMLQNRCLVPRISGMVADEATNYTVLGAAMLMRYGARFTAQDVASAWLAHLPLLETCTAERAAYRNLVAGVAPPASAVQLNPYREWIGAQVRADIYGYVNPGDPARAAEWAWRDASISHVKNGLYGSIWVAAMLAAAAVLDDWETVIRAGLDQVPAHCRLREDVETILALWQDGADYGIACEFIHAQWNERSRHDWHHVNANAQIVAAALLWGDDAFGQSVAQAVMCGFDTASNGATVGSLWGVMHGVDHIPEIWTRPVHNTLHTRVTGYAEVAIDKLADKLTHLFT